MTTASNNSNQTAKLARRYRAALRRYLKETTRAKPASALKLGHAAAGLGLDVLELASIHEKTKPA